MRSSLLPLLLGSSTSSSPLLLGSFMRGLESGEGSRSVFQLRWNMTKSSPAELQEIAEYKACTTEPRAAVQAGNLMQTLRALGYIPRHHTEHHALAVQHNRASKGSLLSALEIAEAEALTSAHATELVVGSKQPTIPEVHIRGGSLSPRSNLGVAWAR